MNSFFLGVDGSTKTMPKNHQPRRKVRGKMTKTVFIRWFKSLGDGGAKRNAHQTNSSRAVGRRSQRRGTSVQDSTVNDAETVPNGRSDQDAITEPQSAKQPSQVSMNETRNRSTSDRDSQNLKIGDGVEDAVFYQHFDVTGYADDVLARAQRRLKRIEEAFAQNKSPCIGRLSDREFQQLENAVVARCLSEL